MFVLRAFEPILLPPLAFVTAEVVNVKRAIRLARASWSLRCNSINRLRLV